MNQRIRNRWTALLLAGVAMGCIPFAAPAAPPQPVPSDALPSEYRRGYEAGYRAAKAETERATRRSEKEPKNGTPGQYTRNSTGVRFPRDTFAAGPRFIGTPEFYPDEKLLSALEKF